MEPTHLAVFIATTSNGTQAHGNIDVFLKNGMRNMKDTHIIEKSIAEQTLCTNVVLTNLIKFD